jgi:hypothetical protein
MDSLVKDQPEIADKQGNSFSEYFSGIVTLAYLERLSRR